MEQKQIYQESINSYTTGYPQEDDIISTPDNLWLYTEDDNLLVSELGDPLVIY